MKQQIKNDTNVDTGTFGKMQLIQDFLPDPKDLSFKEGPEMTKITISLNKDTVSFFKAEAKRLGTPYQRMVRNLLNQYVANQVQKLRKEMGEESE